MGWHKWVEDLGDGTEKHTYAFIPEPHNVTDDTWPQIDCGPEYWMWKDAQDLEAQMDGENYES